MYWLLTFIIAVISAILGSAITLFAPWWREQSMKRQILRVAHSELARYTTILKSVVDAEQNTLVITGKIHLVHAFRISQFLTKEKERDLLDDLALVFRVVEQFNEQHMFATQILVQDENALYRKTLTSAVNNLNIISGELGVVVLQALRVMESLYPKICVRKDFVVPASNTSGA